MIRLIASDLDGTLLTPEGELPEGTFRTIQKLHNRGILFCPASGRQLPALRRMFAPVWDKIAVIAENGAIVVCRGEVLRCETLPRASVLRALLELKKLPDAHALLCTPGCAYYEDEARPFVQLVQASYVDNAHRDLGRVAESEGVCKIAVYDGGGPEQGCMRVLPQALPDLRIILSGGNWLDISEKTTDKGAALRFLREHLGLAREECAAFGDHMNDYEMLLECGHPYVTQNAYPALKERIGKPVPSNAENGALLAIERIADES